MEIVLNVLFIFVLRVLGVSLSTVRFLLMTRGRKLLSAVFGFFQTLVYAVAIGKVVQDLNNIPNLMSYCLGFSVGTLLGMWLEERIAIGFATIRVISSSRNSRMASGFTLWGQRSLTRTAPATLFSPTNLVLLVSVRSLTETL